MKIYVLTTGIIFALIVAAHLARVFWEGFHLMKEPTFVFTSVVSIAMTVWAWRLFRQLKAGTE